MKEKLGNQSQRRARRRDRGNRTLPWALHWVSSI